LPAATRQGSGVTLIELDDLSAPFIAQDWYAWNAALAGLERHWFQPALDALAQGQFESLALTLCGDTGSATLTVKRADLHKFWRRRRFMTLFE
jgi:hypothetical protein